MSAMAGGGVNIGGYRMRVNVRPQTFSTSRSNITQTFSTSRNNISGMMLRSHARRETSAQVMNATIRSDPLRETSRSRRFRPNISSSSVHHRRFGRNMSHSVGIGIQSLIRRDRADAAADLYDLEVRADALEVLRSSLVLTLRSTGDVRIWLNILRQYRESFVTPDVSNGQNIFKNLPSVDISEEDVQCSICLRDFKIGDKAKSLPCDHKFHSACIRPWLKRAVTCPMCRYHLTPTQSPAQSPPMLVLPLRRRSPSSGRRRYVTLQ